MDAMVLASATESVSVVELKAISKELRVQILRMLEAAGSGHPGGSLSVIDLLTVLYFKYFRYDPQNPKDPRRDRFILSKGHCVPALYAVMAKLGYFPEGELSTLRKLDSRLQGHPDRHKLPFLEANTGSLGQGLSIAIGMALAGRLSKSDHRVWCVTGDGEIQEGQVWEAFMSAPKFGLDNLTVIVDYNKVQQENLVKDAMDLDPLPDKLKAFRWHVQEIDGHDHDQIVRALDSALKVRGRPQAIVSNTVKGKGVSFMELKTAWHGKAPNKEEAERAIREILEGN